MLVFMLCAVAVVIASYPKDQIFKWKQDSCTPLFSIPEGTTTTPTCRTVKTTLYDPRDDQPDKVQWNVNVWGGYQNATSAVHSDLSKSGYELLLPNACVGAFFKLCVVFNPGKYPAGVGARFMDS